MEKQFELSYVVILNDGVNAHEAEAGFNNLNEAIGYADTLAGYREPFNPGDSLSVELSARVAHYEVVDAVKSDDAWETVYETSSFYND